jgi:hypothetical protein
MVPSWTSSCSPWWLYLAAVPEGPAVVLGIWDLLSLRDYVAETGGCGANPNSTA